MVRSHSAHSSNKLKKCFVFFFFFVINARFVYYVLYQKQMRNPAAFYRVFLCVFQTNIKSAEQLKQSNPNKLIEILFTFQIQLMAVT